MFGLNRFPEVNGCERPARAAGMLAPDTGRASTHTGHQEATECSGMGTVQSEAKRARTVAWRQGGRSCMLLPMLELQLTYLAQPTTY